MWQFSHNLSLRQFPLSCISRICFDKESTLKNQHRNVGPMYHHGIIPTQKYRLRNFLRVSSLDEHKNTPPLLIDAMVTLVNSGL